MQQKIDGLLVPKLRFPEFQDEGEWEEKTLGEICKFIRGPFGGSLKKDMFVKDGYAVYEQSHAIYQTFDSFRYYIAEDKFNELKRFSVHPNDLIMSCSGTMGKFAIIPKESKRGVINQALLKLTAKKGLDIRFIKTTMELPSSQEKLLSQSAGGAIKNVVAVGQIKEIILYIPSIPEQQKITACLSSISDRITAETQKLDTLKAHKKGLMQQLFPAEGETLPKLRFPEFLEAGEWEEKKLEQIGDISMCKRIFAEETNDTEGVPFFKIGTLGRKPDAFISKKLFDEYKSKYNFPRKGEILITCSGTVGKCLTYDGNDAYYQDFNIVWIDNPTLEISNQLLHNMLLKINWGRLNSTTITRIYGSDLRNLSIIFPANQSEQQKVADCLSSLDDRITAQTQKIDTIKTHKKGLMQQLFPAVDEVSG